jgi:hypothetical protein
VTRRTTRWLLGSLVALLTAWVLAPAVVPVYDGIGNPDEPYRYVNPPADAKTTKQPTVARQTVGVRNGTNVTQFANSAETGPQVSVYVPAGSLDVPSGVTSIELTATPKAPAPPLPADGTIVGNVYDIVATADGKLLDVVGTGKEAPTLQFRAPTAKQPGPVFEHRTPSGWVQSRTIRVGNDFYQTSAEGLGEWALVELAQTGQKSGGGGGVNVGLLVGGIAVLLAAGGILAIRLRRTAAAGD